MTTPNCKLIPPSSFLFVIHLVLFFDHAVNKLKVVVSYLNALAGGHSMRKDWLKKSMESTLVR